MGRSVRLDPMTIDHLPGLIESGLYPELWEKHGDHAFSRWRFSTAKSPPQFGPSTQPDGSIGHAESRVTYIPGVNRLLDLHVDMVRRLTWWAHALKVAREQQEPVKPLVRPSTPPKIG